MPVYNWCIAATSSPLRAESVEFVVGLLAEIDAATDARQARWSLGKLAALASSVQQATIQREAARRLSERIDLIREIHESVIQRLFGLVLVLGSDDEKLDAEQRRVCHDELRDVLGELRDALGRARRVQDPTTTMTVRQV